MKTDKQIAELLDEKFKIGDAFLRIQLVFLVKWFYELGRQEGAKLRNTLNLVYHSNDEGLNYCYVHPKIVEMAEKALKDE
jgi:hypothetical protein